MVELVRDFCKMNTSHKRKYTSFVIIIDMINCQFLLFLYLFVLVQTSLYLSNWTMLFICHHLIGNWGIPDTCPCVTLYPSLLQVTLYSYNWSVDLGTSLNRELVRLVQWQNARAHVVHCLLNQKMGLFHHYCFSDAPIHEMDSKQVKTLPCLNQFRRHCWFLRGDRNAE